MLSKEKLVKLPVEGDDTNKGGSRYGKPFQAYYSKAQESARERGQHKAHSLAEFQIEVVGSFFGFYNEARPGNGPVNNVGSDHRAEAPVLQVSTLKAFVQHDSIARIS